MYCLLDILFFPPFFLILWFKVIRCKSIARLSELWWGGLVVRSMNLDSVSWGFLSGSLGMVRSLCWGVETLAAPQGPSAPVRKAAHPWRRCHCSHSSAGWSSLSSSQLESAMAEAVFYEQWDLRSGSATSSGVGGELLGLPEPYFLNVRSQENYSDAAKAGERAQWIWWCLLSSDVWVHSVLDLLSTVDGEKQLPPLSSDLSLCALAGARVHCVQANQVLFWDRVSDTLSTLPGLELDA